jgi:DNA-binding CsgD family transcriptional regulator
MRQRDLNEESLLASLTEKQRQVLDLLIEHKTSKEIARLLNISPHTVDQRIQFAKEKLGAGSRGELAVVYRRLLEICGKMTYDDSGIAARVPEGDGTTEPGELPEQPSTPKPTKSGPPETEEPDYQAGGKLLEGRYGTLIRIGAIVGIAVLLLLVVLGTLATFLQLSQLLGK